MTIHNCEQEIKRFIESIDPAIWRTIESRLSIDIGRASIGVKLDILVALAEEEERMHTEQRADQRQEHEEAIRRYEFDSTLNLKEKEITIFKQLQRYQIESENNRYLAGIVQDGNPKARKEKSTIQSQASNIFSDLADLIDPYNPGSGNVGFRRALGFGALNSGLGLMLNDKIRPASYETVEETGGKDGKVTNKTKGTTGGFIKDFAKGAFGSWIYNRGARLAKDDRD